MENETQILKIKATRTCYNILLLPADYLQIVAVNLDTKVCCHNIFCFQQLDSVVRTQFRDNRQLFEAISSSKSRCLQLGKESNEVLTVNIENQNNLISIDFPLRIQESPIQKANQSEISSYRKRLEEVCDENKKLYIQNKDLEEKITDLLSQLRLAKLNFEAIERKLKRLEQQFKDRQYHQRQIQLNVAQLPLKMTFKVPLQSQDYNKEIIEQAKLNPFIFVPFETHFLKHFTIQGQKIKIQKGFKDFYQVTSEAPIPLTGKTKVSIKVVHTKLTSIYFGVLKESRRKEKFTCQHKESLSYKLRGGKFLFQDGLQSGEQVPWVKEGDTLNMSLDRQSKEVTWFIEDKYMIKRRIPPTMEKEPLYVFVSLHDEGDQIQIL